jgi:hypothetical protein
MLLAPLALLLLLAAALGLLVFGLLAAAFYQNQDNVNNMRS